MDKVYYIADFFIRVNNVSNRLLETFKPYEVELKNFTYDISIDYNDFDFGTHTYTENNFYIFAVNEVHKKFANILYKNNAFVLHSATFDVDGVGVAFAAHSGTGKTTHMNLWQQLLGDKMTIVNGDKPIVRFFDEEPDTPYAYGTPWNGKEKLGCNMRTPLKHICFIERSETNYVEKVQKQDVIDRIFNQVYMPKDPVAVVNTMQLIDRLLSCTNLWIIHCNMEPKAAEVAYNTIINGKTE